MRRFVLFAMAVAAALAYLAGAPPETFRFVILGDRTGEAQPGVYEEVWKEAAAENPALVVATGDTIQGLDDQTAEREWAGAARILRAYQRFPLYLTPGNHDIWSPASEKLFRRYSGHALHYGFDRGQAHFTVLDNSRTDDLPEEELKFLESDLREHASQPVKFVLSHRPSWLLRVALGAPQFPLHRLAKQYGVRYVVTGHVHQLLRAGLEGVTYFSMPSSGAHLRLSQQYEDGWFFAYALVEVKGSDVVIRIKELKPPHGQARTTELKDWGLAGLTAR